MSSQTSLDFASGAMARIELGEGCWLEHLPGFVPFAEAERFMSQLRDELPWVQELYQRGRWIPAPRLTSFHADPGCSYTYSGIRYEPAPWTAALLELRARVCAQSGCAFNSMLANYYRDGRDSLGYHADAEPELGPSRDDIAIGSLSLGARRRFVLKHKRDGRRWQLDLGEGDLLVMRGRTQSRFVHALPKTKLPAAERINLTFRVIVRGAPS